MCVYDKMERELLEEINKTGIDPRAQGRSAQRRLAVRMLKARRRTSPCSRGGLPGAATRCAARRGALMETKK